MCMQTLIIFLWYFWVLYCVVIIEETIVCLSSNVLSYKVLHLPHSTFPLINSAHTLMELFTVQ